MSSPSSAMLDLVKTPAGSNHNKLVISEDELGAPQEFLLSDSWLQGCGPASKSLSVRLWGGLLDLDQTADTAYSLRDKWDKYLKEVAELMATQWYHYVLCMMTLLLIAELSIVASSVFSLYDKPKGRAVLRFELVLMFPEAPFYWNQVKMRPEKGGYP